MKQLLLIIIVLLLLTGCAPITTPEAKGKSAQEIMGAMPDIGDGAALAADNIGIDESELSKILSMIGNADITDAHTYIDDKDYFNAFSQEQCEALRVAVQDVMNTEYENYLEQLNIVNNYIYYIIDLCADQFGFVMDDTFIRDFRAKVDKRYDQRVADRQAWLNEYFDSTVLPAIIGEMEFAADFESVETLLEAYIEETASKKNTFSNGEQCSDEADVLVEARLKPYWEFTADLRSMEMAEALREYDALLEKYPTVDPLFAQMVMLVPYRSDCRVWVYRYDYEKALRRTKGYIDVLGLSEDHELYAVRDLLKTASDAMDSCVMEYDEFEDEVTIFHKKVTEISERANFVPYYGDDGFHALLGFAADDWVGFERVTIKVADGEVITYTFEYSDVVRHVDREVFEIADVAFSTFDMEDIARMLAAEHVTMRFIGEDDRHDHALTGNECAAIETIYNLAVAHHDLMAIFE